MAAVRESFNATGNSPTGVHQSPWHSPVPYLFGGLAAMLGLIAFALLMLACSYWKFSCHHENGSPEGDLEAGEETDDDGAKPGKAVFEEKILVIMAGDVKPTILATPMSCRASSFGERKREKSAEKEDTMKEREDGESHTNSHQHH